MLRTAIATGGNWYKLSYKDVRVPLETWITGGKYHKHREAVCWYFLKWLQVWQPNSIKPERWQFLKWMFVLWLEQVWNRVWADIKKWNAGRNMRKSLKRIAKYFWSGVHFCQRAGLEQVWKESASWQNKAKAIPARKNLVYYKRKQTFDCSYNLNRAGSLIIDLDMWKDDPN